MDIFVTTFAMDNYVLFHNDGKGFFSDVSFPSGVGNLQFPIWAGEHSSSMPTTTGISICSALMGTSIQRWKVSSGRNFVSLFSFSKTWGTANFEMTPALSGWVHLPPQSARGASFGDSTTTAISMWSSR